MLSRRRVVVTLPAVVVLALAGCAAPKATPKPAPSAVPLRAIATCAATVVVPAETAQVALVATSPATRVVSVGDAVQFKVPRGARIGLLDAPQGEVDAQLCTAAKPPVGAAVLVAVGAGYVRVGIQVGAQDPASVYVRVNPE